MARGNLPQSTGRIDSRIQCRSNIEKLPCAGGVHRFVSFVTTTKPKPSLTHNLKSVPLVLTADNEPLSQGRARLHAAIRRKTVERRRDAPLALTFMKKVLKRHGKVEVIVTDGLRS
jgi:hypothetical protein